MKRVPQHYRPEPNLPLAKQPRPAQASDSAGIQSEATPARLLTLGIHTQEPLAESITSDVPLQLKPGDFLLIDGQGDRLAWTGPGDQRELAGILPSPAQQQEISAFLASGGTVITFPADPAVTAKLTLYREELPQEQEWSPPTYPVEVSGDLAEIAVRPFDWLPQEIWPALRETFELFCREKLCPQQRWDQAGGLRVMRRSTVQVITLRMASGTLAICRDSTVALRFLKDMLE